MALGGGIWIAQNKIIPGAYINTVSAKRVNRDTADRGISALAFESDWGESNKVIEITKHEFERDCKVLFGYDLSSPKLRNLRELFKHSSKACLYRICKSGVKASNKYADAKYEGTRGNKITILVKQNIDQTTKFDVSTLVDNTVVDKQTVSSAKELYDNAYVVFKKGATLQAEAGVPLANGTNGSNITGNDHMAFLKAIESYNFNSLGCVSDDNDTKKIYASFVKRMREEVGVKFQLVLHNYPKADYEGIISIKNGTNADLVYWVTGANAGCKISESLTNFKYDGELDINTEFTQDELENYIRNGEFVLHTVGKDVRVLRDVNTLQTLSDTKSDDFKENRAIRVLDGLAEDTARLFNEECLSKIPNDDDGRVALWNKEYELLKKYNSLRVINKPKAEDVRVAEGSDSRSVYMEVSIHIVYLMEKLYAAIKVI